MGWEIRILGAVAAWNTDKLLFLPRRQQRLLLGFLALEINQVVSCERLIDLLWEDRPPRGARAVVQSRISELRAAIRTASQTDREVGLVTHGGGYAMRAEPELVDAHRFKILVARSRGAATDVEARQSLRDAQARWRS